MITSNKQIDLVFVVGCRLFSSSYRIIIGMRLFECSVNCSSVEVVGFAINPNPFSDDGSVAEK